MKKLTMLLLACALMALTNAAAVPEAEPEAVKEEASVQEAAAESEPVVEEPPVQEDVPEEELEELTDESFLPEDLPEESEDVETLENMEENDSLIQRSRRCPPGWMKFRDRCFIFRPFRVTWAHAERNCLAKGGHLVSIHSFEEHDFIQWMIFVLTSRFPLTWIGASDARQEGHWRWSDGSNFLATYWCPREPNNWRGQDCVQMNYGPNLCWADVSCYTHLPYVCARDL